MELQDATVLESGSVSAMAPGKSLTDLHPMTLPQNPHIK